MFVNLTPHEINVQTPSGKFLTIEPSGYVARAETIEEYTNDVGGIPAITRKLGKPIIPEIPIVHDEVIFYIVSSMVLEASKSYDPDIHENARIIAPDTGKTAIRNENGKIKAITRFVK